MTTITTANMLFAKVVFVLNNEHGKISRQRVNKLQSSYATLYVLLYLLNVVLAASAKTFGLLLNINSTHTNVRNGVIKRD